MNKLLTMEDLRALRKDALGEMTARQTCDIQVIVGMGTCGIAAGAREVVTELLKELQRRNIKNVSVTKTGCIGMCEREVLLDVVRPNEDRVTYGRVVPRDVSRIVGEHIVNGRVVEGLVVGRITS
ncbi:MAG: (2Fe-2S) ferredoxin domain-containing protein [Dethiobacter sp.]|jgi:NADP-reducing hydrogenase subunit HndB|nr:(2Fe-2S) ferredoxin domain-containing protein [Dethiobacter sp.]MBS3899384.1 (2Fe-2S) ferredoxin domain-containing protein [Dethiobacter sp.]MBS3983063.1 (2Fe-2S) ferredoxin domain-containing protein [Dethiobacter sp.]MCL4463845.1 (2Fe-2S) ferredoxin domain-containing protein [Bacillota bacterium]MCL5993463.1 (2Fe-2S) ferredoxin domain-containing protein [Bacillota bacterium]